MSKIYLSINILWVKLNSNKNHLSTDKKHIKNRLKICVKKYDKKNRSLL